MNLMRVLRNVARPVFGGISRLRTSIRVHLYWGLRLQHIGPGVFIASAVKILSPGKVTVGSRVSINSFVHIWGGGGVTIGANSMVASHAVLTSQTHDLAAIQMSLPYRDTNVHAPIRIGENVWIGSGAVILPGVTVGDGAVVGAGAVVTRDVAPHSLVAGVPARLVRRLL